MAIAQVKFGNDTWIDLTKNNTVTANDLVAPATAKNSLGEVITGQLIARDSSNITFDGQNLVVPQGVYTNDTSYDLVADNTGIVIVDSSSVAHVSGNINTVNGSTITPSSTAQVIPKNSFLLDNVTIAPIPSDYIIPSGSKTITSNGNNIDVAQYSTVDVNISAPSSNIDALTVDPGKVAKTIYASSQNLDGFDPVIVNAIPNDYVGDGINRLDSSDMVVAGPKVTVPAGYFSESAFVNVQTGTLGTPTFDRLDGSHSVRLTPKIENPSTGYIVEANKYGTPITISAADLVSGNYSIASSGTKDVTNYATATVAAGAEGTPTLIITTSADGHTKHITPTVTNTTGFINASTSVSGERYTISASDLVSDSLTITANAEHIDVTNLAEVTVAVNNAPSIVPLTVTPRTTEQVFNATTNGDDGYNTVTVAAISPIRTGTDITFDNAMVTVSSGYYSTTISKPLPGGSVTVPNQTISTVPTINISNGGIITAQVSTAEHSIAPTVHAGYVTEGTAGIVTVGGTKTLELTTQAATTITPTTAAQTAVDEHVYTLGKITVAPIPSNYIVPSGAKLIEANEDGIDVTQYATVNVRVPVGTVDLQSKDVTPSESAQTVYPDTGYALSSVNVAAIPNTFVGSGIARRDETNLQSNMYPAWLPHFTGENITLSRAANTNAGYLSIQGTTLTGRLVIGDTITIGGDTYEVNIETAQASNNTLSNIRITPNLTQSYPVGTSVTIDAENPYVAASAGYYAENAKKEIQPANHLSPTITLDSATGRVTASHTQSVGYLKMDHTIESFISLPTSAAATYYPSTTNQTIAAGTYLTGVQTISKVITSGISAGNIKFGATVKVGDEDDDDRITGITGTFTAASTVSTGQTAATANQLLSGYSAWVDGTEIKGSILSKNAATYYPSTTNQTIAANQYLSGTQTIKALTITNLTAGNIAEGVTIKIGDEDDDDRIISITGTHAGGSGGGNIGPLTVTPADEPITIDASLQNLDGFNPVYVNAIPASYANVTNDTVTADSMLAGKTAHILRNGIASKITGTIPTNTTADLTTSGATVTVPSGYYSSTVTKDVTTITLPTTTTTTQPSGTAQATISRSSSTRYLNIPAGYQAGGYYTISAVPDMVLPTVAATSTNGGTAKATIIRSTSTQYINIGTGFNSSAAYYTIEAVPNGTAGVPTATKGTVSDHTISVTPSVTNTTGYITGSTKTGTAVTVSATELVSGTRNISGNGEFDVTNYQKVNVQVSSEAPSFQTQSKTATPTTSAQTITPDNGYDGLSDVTVNAIPANYADVTDDTVYAAGLLAGYTAHVLNNGVATQITGTMATKTANDITYASNNNNLELTIPAGYYQANVKSILGTTHDAPTISVNTSTGRVTASHTQTEGWIGSNNTKTAYTQLSTQAAATYYPSTSDQTIAAEKYLTEAQTIKAVQLTNLVAGNIKEGVTIEIGDADDSDRIISVTGTFGTDITPMSAATILSICTIS